MYLSIFLYLSYVIKNVIQKGASNRLLHMKVCVALL